jgi:hypothetical protein
MLGDIDGGAAVLASQRQPLQQAKNHENDRSRDANRRVARKKSDRSR